MNHTTLPIQISPELLTWLLESGEPWTRYRALVDLLGLPEDDPQVQAARAELMSHPQVAAMAEEVRGWPGYVFQRHNDSNHPIYKLSTLADFGLRAGDDLMQPGLEAVLAHQSPEGAFQSLVNIPRTFGGTGVDTWLWVLCDAPTLLYALLAMGLEQDARVQRAAQHLAGLVDENGWRCRGAEELGKFRGPGRKEAPCPIANVFALKALSLAPGLLDSPATRAGAEMLLSHWEQRGEVKHYLFGIGSDFHKLKYPFVWYDILHVAEVLSRFPFVRHDPRFREMLEAILAQAGGGGRYTAGSMYKAWKSWSFADKKNPSPWLTLLVYRLIGRVMD